jgi:hypothetical protein
MRPLAAVLFIPMIVVFAASTRRAGAQSVAQRVVASDGTVQIVFPSRPSACGDGESFIGNVLGQSNDYSGSATFSGHGSWANRPCVHGPARVVATVLNGEVTRLRLYVGPVPAARPDVRAMSVSSSDAATWLSGLVARAPARVADDAMLPLVVADAGAPWPLLLSVARDDSRPRDVRRSAITWLGSGVADHLGLADERSDTDDDQMRAQAVFVLSQRPKDESVPELLDLARQAKNPAVRRAAIFWLSQTGDSRATDLYAQLLGKQ